MFVVPDWLIRKMGKGKWKKGKWKKENGEEKVEKGESGNNETFVIHTKEPGK